MPNTPKSPTPAELIETARLIGLVLSGATEPSYEPTLLDPVLADIFDAAMVAAGPLAAAHHEAPNNDIRKKAWRGSKARTA